MKFLCDPKEINATVINLLSNAQDVFIATAWASHDFESYNLLKKNRHKIKKMIIGTHFYQTHPNVLNDFKNNPNVRFVLDTDEVFHPKIYIFSSPNKFDCLIGSANFTRGGFLKNYEIMVHLTNETISQNEKERILKKLNDYWRMGETVNQEIMNAYTILYKKKLPSNQNKKGKFLKKHDVEDGGKAPMKIPILSLSWDNYVKKLKNERNGKAIRSRLEMIEDIQQLFKKYSSLKNMNEIDRRKVAGLIITDEIDYGWFGSMVGAGRFKNVVKENFKNLSQALDLISFKDDVEETDYQNYIQAFKKCFKYGGEGIATATRLLAMKRPDQFVCLNSLNRIELSKSFSIKQNVSFDEYWGSIILRIRDSVWWNSEFPQNNLEKRIWNTRAALLDGLFYKRN